ncbi:MAG: type I-E CRISPR-associated protein Cse1/CasA [Clostridiales bacterium]|nr:type I-E CRISPR-associated protein Cse1/CasA [Clostridiales bacterium]
MGRYNLLDEKWIMVLREETGQTEKVSLKEVFAHAGDYYNLAGEMKTQDFAILRVLLAVLQTVFSRFDSEGNPYDFLEINDETFQQLNSIHRRKLKGQDPFFKTWLGLWMKGEFPEIVQEYLEAWRDHFYLFDDRYPFYQITPDEMEELVEDESKKKVKDKSKIDGKVYGRSLNRMISESANKIALFAPVNGKQLKYDEDKDKDKLYDDQLARWLIMFQGYTGTSDKSEIDGTNKNTTKGWLYELGGIYLKGHNLFETLMLNCILSSKFDGQFGNELKVQIPSWERSPRENVAIYFHNQVDNRASLYTNWSRAISILDDYREREPFYCFPAKLPKIDSVENFLEPMTCWGPKKKKEDKFKPEVHKQDVAVWRNFNVLMGVDREDGEYFRRPGILSWYDKICENSSMRELVSNKVTICSVSMQEDGTASHVLVDEIIDEIQLETAVLIDNNKDGWIGRINTVVDETEKRIEGTLIKLIKQVALIRRNKDDVKSLSKEDKKYLEHLKEQERERIYLEIDQSFRDWLYKIKETDSMDAKAAEWYGILKDAIINKGEEIYNNASFKDLKGVQQEGKGFVNIATAYNEFRRNVNKQFKS